MDDCLELRLRDSDGFRKAIGKLTPHRLRVGRLAGLTLRAAMSDGQIRTKPHKAAPQLRAEVGDG